MKLILILFFSAIALQGCSVFKKIAGADIDPEQFEKARQARMLEVKFQYSAKLAKRLTEGEPLDNADISFFLSESFLDKLVNQYVGAKGWLDNTTNYTVQSIDLTLHNGSAIATLKLDARSEKFNVDVKLTMDCILALEQKEKDITAIIEPFNISPDVDAKGILGGTDEIIANLVKINLAQMGKNFPPIKIPVEFINKFEMNDTNMEIKDKVNLIVKSPKRSINYSLRLKEILIFEGKAFISLNLVNTEVK